MKARSAEIAIIGAGPAGAHLASRLAAEGRDVVLFDPKGAWEKPCGGGVPTRAIREFAFILESSGYPRKLVRQITMISPLDRRVTLTLNLRTAQHLDVQVPADVEHEAGEVIR